MLCCVVLQAGRQGRLAVTRSASKSARQCCGLPQTHLQLSEDRHPCELGTLAPSAISLRLGVTRAALELT